MNAFSDISPKLAHLVDSDSLMSDSQTKPQREPRALSTEYHKARKQLMLWAGILFIWELVGVDLGKAEAAGGNVGAIISSIRSPQAVPWVLLILVAYFLFKTCIEWYQCSVGRRALRASRVDFTSAWAISLCAYGLYAYQAISRIQVADRFQADGGWLPLIFLLTSLLAWNLFHVISSWRRQRPLGWHHVTRVICALLGILYVITLTVLGRLDRRSIAILLITSITILVFGSILEGIFGRKVPAERLDPKG